MFSMGVRLLFKAALNGARTVVIETPRYVQKCDAPASKVVRIVPGTVAHVSAFDKANGRPFVVAACSQWFCVGCSIFV